MAKFYGVIGYETLSETKKGVYQPTTVERCYAGDMLRNIAQHKTSSDLNDDITFDKRISIVADQFAYENFSAIRYVKYMGAKWKVLSAEPTFPRIILTIGGVYNG